MHELLLLTAGLSLPPAEGYDLATMTEIESSLSILASVENPPSCLRVEQNGSTLFFGGFSSDSIQSYNLATPYSTIGATLSSDSLDTSGREGTLVDFTFINNGASLLTCGFSGFISQYTLTTPYNLASGSYSGVSLNPPGSPSSVEFNPSGTILLVSTIEGIIHRYDLATPFDIATATLNSNSLTMSSIVPGFNVAYAMRVVPTGSRMFVTGFSEDIIYQVDMATPFDLSTATYSSVNLVAPVALSAAYALEVADQGRSLYLTGSGSRTVYRYQAT